MRKTVRKFTLLVCGIVVFFVVFYHIWLKHQYVVPILMYHHIADGENESLYVKPDNFFRQMAYIKWRRYNVISLDELVAGIKSGKDFAHKTVVVTFDDGYKDNYTDAKRILKNCDFPATIFLASGDIGNKEGYLTWQQVNEIIKDSKITFGSHTKNHVYLPSIKSKDELKDEILGCKLDIEAKTGQKIDYFCYPAGGFTDEIKKIVKEAGYKGACTTNRGFVKFNEDVYELKRIKVKNSDFVKKPLNFWFKLSGYYYVFKKEKNPS